eukprot:scaffold3971_cov417-Prasinococcus_capsulatus_cf.AAC.1
MSYIHSARAWREVPAFAVLRLRLLLWRVCCLGRVVAGRRCGRRRSGGCAVRGRRAHAGVRAGAVLRAFRWLGAAAQPHGKKEQQRGDQRQRPPYTQGRGTGKQQGAIPGGVSTRGP